MMDLMVKYMLLVYAIVLSFVVLEVSSASVLFESALGPEGSIHLGPSSTPDAPLNVVPSDAAAPVTSIPEGSPPSPPLIQPTIPVTVPPIPQPGPATKSPAYPPTTSVQITPPPAEVVQNPPPVAQAPSPSITQVPPPSITQVPPPSISQVPPSMPESPLPSILPEPVASPPTTLPMAPPPFHLPLPAEIPPSTLPSSPPPMPPTMPVPPSNMTAPVASPPSTLPINPPPSPPILTVPPPNLPTPAPAASPPSTLPINPPLSSPILTVPPPNLPTPPPVASPPSTLPINPPPSPPIVTVPPPNLPTPPPAASPPSTLPINPPPSPPILSVPPPNLPAPVASSPSTLPIDSPPSPPTLSMPPPNSPVPVASPPHASDINVPPPQPTLAVPPTSLPVPVVLPPSNSPLRHNSSIPPPNLPEPHISPVSTPIPPSPANQTTNYIAPTQPPPVKAPVVHNAPPPHSSHEPPPTKSRSPPSLPPVYPPPPAGPKSKPIHHNPPPPLGPESSPRHPDPPTPSRGSKVSPVENSISPTISPPTMSPPVETTMPVLPPKVSPSRSSPRIPKPLQALPPPPPNEDCTIMCVEPLTNTPPGTPCKCVLPMQVELGLGVSLYIFFPLVSELAFEMAAGLSMKSSQVRIMGANEDNEDSEKTVVMINLVPLGEKFDNFTAYVTAQRLWLKQVPIKSSLFGDYEVLFVKYPGLPPSPPMPSSRNGNGGPYGHGNNGRDIKPLGVDISKQRSSNRLSGGIISIIVLSAVVAVVLVSVAAWVLLVKRREGAQSGHTPPATLLSVTKSSGVGGSAIGSGPESASLSFRSNIAYKGSAKTFSSSDMEKATDNFNELGVLGEGGFGRVYRGTLEDGTKVAVKVLKRDDKQGGREFLAEVEMLSRLHHRNLVRLLGICTEERNRCLVYELIPNGSVESHLHGFVSSCSLTPSRLCSSSSSAGIVGDVVHYPESSLDRSSDGTIGDIVSHPDVCLDTSRTWIPSVGVADTPNKGIVFASVIQAYNFYRNYAKLSGFDIKLGTECRDSSSANPSIKYFSCRKSGKKRESKYDKHKLDYEADKRIRGRGKGKRADKGKGIDMSQGSDAFVKKRFRKNTSCKTDCPASMRVRKIEGDVYEVYWFVAEHNHPLVSPQDMQFLMNSRDLGFSKQRFLMEVSTANVGPVKAFKMMKEMYGGFENVGLTVVDCKNFRRDMNLFIGDRDAQMVVEKLDNLEKHGEGFFFDYYVGEGDALSGLFWADNVAKLNYKRFGDVLSFDATFRSNKYKMVFVPFTGIDNHNHSVTFGAGLLSDETIASYKWLLKAFQKAFVSDPQVVVTDQDPSMKQAIADVFPNARHRLCMWHIMQKVTTKVGSAICRDSDFKRRLCGIVWNDQISPSIFEEEWASIIADFDLSENKWLSDIYEMRSRWIPAFLRDEDMSGLMRTTSRSESENHFFGRFTNPHLTLVEFLSHFDSAMDSQRYIQRKNDHESRYNTPEYRTDLKLEKDAAEFYSLSVFFDVQDELVSSIIHCLSVNVEKIGLFDKFFIRDNEVKKWKDKNSYEVYEVLYCSSDMSVTCSCKRFDLFGLLCRHIFYVLRMNNVRDFPKEYVMDRWSKTPESFSFDASVNVAESSSCSAYRAIRQIVEDTVDKLMPFKDKLETYRLQLIELMDAAEEEVPADHTNTKAYVFCSVLGVSEPVGVPKVKVPWQAKNKGSGSHSRWKNMDELLAESSKKRRTCFTCGRAEGHNSRTCPYKDTINASRKRSTRSTRSADVNYQE